MNETPTGVRKALAQEVAGDAAEPIKASMSKAFNKAA
jgi:hypothetical protein